MTRDMEHNRTCTWPTSIFIAADTVVAWRGVRAYTCGEFQSAPARPSHRERLHMQREYVNVRRCQGNGVVSVRGTDTPSYSSTPPLRIIDTTPLPRGNTLSLRRRGGPSETHLQMQDIDHHSRETTVRPLPSSPSLLVVVMLPSPSRLLSSWPIFHNLPGRWE